VGTASLADRDYVERTQAFTRSARAELVQGLRRIPGVHVWEGCANYVLVKWPGTEIDARAWHRQLLAQGVAVRVCDNFVGLDARYLRLAVRPPREQARLLGLLGAPAG
jgi:histidinol-phosphate/aromatic aminotransferase/cobyric acid decarboxylase-like protein